MFFFSRLLHKNDSLSSQNYPSYRSISSTNAQYCMICNYYVARWVNKLFRYKNCIHFFYTELWKENVAGRNIHWYINMERKKNMRLLTVIHAFKLVRTKIHMNMLWLIAFKTALNGRLSVLSAVYKWHQVPAVAVWLQKIYNFRSSVVYMPSLVRERPQKIIRL